MKRRHALQLPALALAGCEAGHTPLTGGFVGQSVDRGHLLRQERGWPPPAVVRRTGAVIAGGGIAGLAAARALRQRGVDDFVLLELEDEAGGNSRGGSIGGLACPLGAHYLPVPGDDVPEVQQLLEELGLRRRVAGRWEYDELHLCHSPQERLFFRGAWQDGLLPVEGVGTATQAEYRRFAAQLEALRRAEHFAIPVQRSAFGPAQRDLDALTFAAWLDREGYRDPQLRWYLDYCCRDDYGAGLARVSAWAGIHYFASRHGFHAPGDEDGEREPVLTWPEGNAFLARALARPLGDRLRPGRVVLRIAEGRGGVEVDAWNVVAQQVERWTAPAAVVALPLHVAARVVEGPPEVLREAAGAIPHAPWLVANVRIESPLADRPGPAPSWDNVLYGTAGLGYVDAGHQSLDPAPGPTVLSWYRPLGDMEGGRRQLLERPWTAWRDELLAELAVPHPDLPAAARRIEIARYGHAMAMPVPGSLARVARWGATPGTGRLAFAHSDWSAYSVFEEAFVRGLAAGQGLRT